MKQSTDGINSLFDSAEIAKLMPKAKALETACAFLKLGIPAETVAAGTGLELEEVLELAQRQE